MALREPCSEEGRKEKEQMEMERSGKKD